MGRGEGVSCGGNETDTPFLWLSSPPMAGSRSGRQECQPRLYGICTQVSIIMRFSSLRLMIYRQVSTFQRLLAHSRELFVAHLPSTVSRLQCHEQCIDFSVDAHRMPLYFLKGWCWLSSVHSIIWYFVLLIVCAERLFSTIWAVPTKVRLSCSVDTK